MRKKLATYALAGALGLTAVAGAALVAPAVSYAATGDSAALESRVTSIKDALKGLVTDGTITQAQADQVASTLAEARPEGLGHHGRGGGRGVHLEALTPLGITAEEVRAAAEAGKTLAQLAEEQGVSDDKLVATLVEAQKARLAQAVTDGRLTQGEADEKAAELQARITERLDDPIRSKRGHGRHGGPGADADEQAPSGTPTQEPTASPDA
ncbi:MAG: hypothetical protein JWM62_1002 [Frankiales bacterium]|jgi:hypothetical protein|nr:hypothetical protein [Frankiales bacterium]